MLLSLGKVLPFQVWPLMEQTLLFPRKEHQSYQLFWKANVHFREKTCQFCAAKSQNSRKQIVHLKKAKGTALLNAIFWAMEYASWQHWRTPPTDSIMIHLWVAGGGEGDVRRRTRREKKRFRDLQKPLLSQGETQVGVKICHFYVFSFIFFFESHISTYLQGWWKRPLLEVPWKKVLPP